MPELPEVHTTVTGLQKILPHLYIKNIWTDLAKENQKISHFKHTLKDSEFYKKFKKSVCNKKIIKVERRAKNILIHIEGGHTIVIHMKMTGHLLVGNYSYNRHTNTWSVSDKETNTALRDPYNRFIHVVFTLSNNTHLVFCDSRKFGTVTLLSTKDILTTSKLRLLGPEPLDESFTLPVFIHQLSKHPTYQIKKALMDQTIIAGIGNIYSDELLYIACVHPARKVSTLTQSEYKKMYVAMKEVLEKGIDFGGDSTSDYRRIDGTRGSFHHAHNVYRKKGTKCGKRGCGGVILRSVLGGRSAHYCSVHQK